MTVNEPSAYGAEAQQDYSAYGAQVDTSQYSIPQEEASTLQPIIAPLFSQQRSHTPDPFSWQAQEKNYEETGSAIPPPRPPPMARTPEVENVPNVGVSETSEAVEEESRGLFFIVTLIHQSYLVEPPSRPAPPAAKQPPRPPAPPTASPQKMPPPPPLPPSKTKPAEKQEVEEEDPWARFKQMSEQVSSSVKSVEQQLKSLSETTAAKDVKDESYIAQIGGTQITEFTSAQKQIMKMEEEKKKAKADKKARKSASSKKDVVPQFDPRKEEDVERQAAELVAKMVASRAHDLEVSLPFFRLIKLKYNNNYDIFRAGNRQLK